MKKKTYNLVTGIIGGVETIAIAGTAAIEICSQFVKEV